MMLPYNKWGIRMTFLKEPLLTGFAIYLLMSVSLRDSLIAFDIQPHQNILDVRINSFTASGVDMEESLRLLRRAEPSKILIGFERLPRREGEEERNISVDLNQTTVGSVLNILCKLDPRYTYETVSQNLINVFPQGSKNDVTNILNIRVKEFNIHDKQSPENIIRCIANFAPELRSYLNHASDEYTVRTGIQIASVGAETRGNMDPQISFELQNATVREILNSIVLYSVKLSREHTYISPVSWKYQFIINPRAPSALGGFPRWDVF
jgi:hypothetical protein